MVGGWMGPPGAPGLQTGPALAHESPGTTSPWVFCAQPLLQMSQELHVQIRSCKEQSLKGLKHTEMEKEVLVLGPEESLVVKQCPRKMVSWSETRQHIGRSQAFLGSWTSPEILLGRLSKTGQQIGQRCKAFCRMGQGSAGCLALGRRGVLWRGSEAHLGGTLVVGLQHGRQLRAGRGSTDPEGPRTRFQEVEEILGRAKEWPGG